MNKILEIENLSVSYGNDEIFKNVSFNVNKGDYIGLVGPNGAGKTTLVKAIVGIITPAGGRINPFLRRPIPQNQRLSH